MNTKSKRRPAAFWLMLSIPLASVAFGMVMLWAALSQPDTAVEMDAKPLSKTSWRETP